MVEGRSLMSCEAQGQSSPLPFRQSLPEEAAVAPRRGSAGTAVALSVLLFAINAGCGASPPDSGLSGASSSDVRDEHLDVHPSCGPHRPPDTWRARASMPSARWRFGAAALNGKIYAVGGAGTDGGVLASVE